MASTARPYLILANMKTALEGITSPAAPQAVYLDDGQARDITAEAGPFYLVVPGAESVVARLARGTVTLLEIDWEVHVVAVAKGRTAATSELYGADQTSLIRQAIIGALLADRSRGGYALDTRQERGQWYPEEYQDWDASIALTFAIKYRHRDNDSTLG